MPEQDPLASGVREHRGGNLASEGARGVLVAILPAQRDAGAAGQGGPDGLDQDEGREQDDIDPVAGRGGECRRQFRRFVAEQVHLPIAGDNPGCSLVPGHGRCIAERPLPRQPGLEI